MKEFREFYQLISLNLRYQSPLLFLDSVGFIGILILCLGSGCCLEDISTIGVRRTEAFISDFFDSLIIILLSYYCSIKIIQ